MIEKTILDFLNERMREPVLAEIPANPAAEYVLVVKAGGTTRDFLSTSQIVIVSTGKTLQRAAKSHESVKSIMSSLTELDDVTKVKLLEEGNTTDPLAKRHRYQGVYEITHY